MMPLFRNENQLFQWSATLWNFPILIVWETGGGVFAYLRFPSQGFESETVLQTVLTL